MLAWKAWIIMSIYTVLNSWIVAVPRFGFLYFCPKHMVFSLYFMVHLGTCHAVEVMYLEFSVSRSRLRESLARWLAWAVASKGCWFNGNNYIGDKEQLIQWSPLLLASPPIEETLKSKESKENHLLLDWTYTPGVISKWIDELHEAQEPSEQPQSDNGSQLKLSERENCVVYCCVPRMSKLFYFIFFK